MATFLDVTGLQYFSKFFVFLFVWLVVYALLFYTQTLGSNKAIHALIGLFIALLTLFSPLAIGTVEYIAPWFALLFVFVILVTMALKTFGASSADIDSYVSLKWLILVVAIIIIIVGALAYAKQESKVTGEEASKEFSKAKNIIFHPKMLGAIFILLTAIFTIALLAGRQR